jgi:hypothetical protein
VAVCNSRRDLALQENFGHAAKVKEGHIATAAADSNIRISKTKSPALQQGLFYIIGIID